MQHRKRKLKSETHGEASCYRAGCRCSPCTRACLAAYRRDSHLGPGLKEQAPNPREKTFPCGFDPNRVTLAQYADHVRTCPDQYCQSRSRVYESVKAYFIRRYGNREAAA